MKLRIPVIIAVVAISLVFVAGCRQMCKRCGKTIAVITLDGVHFDFDKATLKPEGKVILDENIAKLKNDKTLTISIEGHCDIIGSDAYNQKLSEKRAKVVYDYFAQGGIDPSRMTYVGYGRSKPIVPNDTAANRAKNRRVEIHIIKGN